MKKLLVATLVALSFGASAANYVSVDVDRVSTQKNSGTDSIAQTIRFGTEAAGVQWGLQSRTARLNGGSLLSSLEVTGGINVGPVAPFVGIGHDNGTTAYNYGLLGATVAQKVGPGVALVGVKTRVGSTQTNPTKQTVGFATYAIPVAKNVSLNVNASRSYQDIKENAFGLGVGFSF